MLTIDLYTWHDVARRKIEYLPLHIPYYRGIGESAFDTIDALRRTIRLHEKRDLRAALEHMTDNALVDFAGIFPEWLQPKDIAQTLNHCRFSRPTAADNDVQVLVEMDSLLIEEAPLPGYGYEFNMLLRWRIGGKTDARDGVEERLPEPLNGDFRYFDIARRTRPREILRATDVLHIEDGNGPLTPILRIFIFQDGAKVVWCCRYWTRKRAGKEMRGFPYSHPCLALEDLK
jgi:hypothetical protein